MTRWLEQNSLIFPDHDEADENGIVAVGGDFSWPRLLEAYHHGVFPWPHENLPLLWFSPDPRMVMKPNSFIINKTLRKTIKNTDFIVKADDDFLAVITACQSVKRKEQGTWITDDLIRGYYDLHLNGFAHNVSVYHDDHLVGGLYGVSLGSMFFGESMFSLKPSASKIAFAVLVAHLNCWRFSLIDCQVHNPYLESLGASQISRTSFLAELRYALSQPTKSGPWQFHLSPLEALQLLAK